MGENNASTKTPSPSIDFVAGVIAGAAGLIVGQPFDVVKVRYQTPSFNGKYTSIHQAFRAILREEGIRGMFKGVMSPMAGIAGVNGIVFSSYQFFMNAQIPKEGVNPTLGQICLAGAGSGVLAATLTCPIELIKIRQQSLPPNLNPNVFTVTLGILRNGGLRGLYRGYSATVIRELAYGPYFWAYEASCRFFKWRRHLPEQPPHGHGLIDEAEAELHSGLNWAELMAAGGVAGVIAWAITFPFDVWKTRMQSADESAKPLSLRRVMVDSVRQEGWRVMFRGLWPCLVRAIPANMVTFLAFETLVAHMA
ncbi:hypothetical protein CcaverHIS002_0206200 [Cutaneotrichosporon cavernicola]|uniref:Mitochondrial carrier n=1 Tax=Cutaneotrichosporon cavernicola TaxID=279322 RepID=A0AA48KYC6_9TREE|nr:uncharacterized protein CcaverHIS019_0206160 [Cutaneotrichosporon cavernicola]BEI81460.1 hypothetical protein CcaverHIS002_0206200 [Cutaneotrichosporon cavernicola]BEI89254.1 hypothetical protein CcaverHIS019_0206160 [Cutaneotrichosporon cavernicola]BEI97030.1 hypothetical protein CcaverHIS631_0206190 [Cutaneotrichosporon cavernicola]BEJ04804.1 hypothetical protein CcaverHIS641_0206210 [Cutaneotrichosporon cavernicola]